MSRLTVKLQAGTRSPGRRVGVRIQWKREGGLEVAPGTRGQDSSVREGEYFQQAVLKQLDVSMGKEKKKKTVTSYIRISLKGLMELKIKAYIVKLTDGNTGKRLCHRVVLKDVLERTYLS